MSGAASADTVDIRKLLDACIADQLSISWEAAAVKQALRELEMQPVAPAEATDFFDASIPIALVLTSTLSDPHDTDITLRAAARPDGRQGMSEIIQTRIENDLEQGSTRETLILTLANAVDDAGIQRSYWWRTSPTSISLKVGGFLVSSASSPFCAISGFGQDLAIDLVRGSDFDFHEHKVGKNRYYNALVKGEGFYNFARIRLAQVVQNQDEIETSQYWFLTVSSR